MRIVAIVVAIVVAFGLGGCSAILSKPPPATPLGSLTECNTSVAPPVGDVVLAAVSGGIATAGVGIAGLEKLQAREQTVPSWDPHRTADAHANTYLAIGLIVIPVAVGLIVSARYGFRSARACNIAAWDFVGRQP